MTPVAPQLTDLTIREQFIISRRRAGLTQSALSRRTGISCPAISRWEHGAKCISKRRLEELYRAVQAAQAELDVAAEVAA